MESTGAAAPVRRPRAHGGVVQGGHKQALAAAPAEEELDASHSSGAEEDAGEEATGATRGDASAAGAACAPPQPSAREAQGAEEGEETEEDEEGEGLEALQQCVPPPRVHPWYCMACARASLP
jgi:hypothetical protein